MTELTHIATLVRGNCWHHGKQRFDKGIPVLVTEEVADHLSINAIDSLTTDGDEGGRETVTKAKFKIERRDDADLASEAEAAANAPRSRGRH